MSLRIPKIIHQTWKTSEISDPFLKRLQCSWIELNPDFEYRFWTDDDLKKFVQEKYPSLLSIYSGYRHPIERVDLARYLVLRHYGGIYADLDCECLKPVGNLINSYSFVIGKEPTEHEKLKKATDRGLGHILCPSFIASVPGHPFWDEILRHVRENANAEDVLDATGPFLLTRAYHDFDDKTSVRIIDPDLLYPFTKEDCWNGRLFDIGFWEKGTRNAYMLHYWGGTWFRPTERRTKVPIRIDTKILKATGSNRLIEPQHSDKGESPLVSCLMVTRGRKEFVRRAIQCFMQQTYTNTELVIVCDNELDTAIKEFKSDRIRILRPRKDNLPLGTLRNLAVAAAKGSYVCQWDDDDLYDPLRIEIQYRALASTKSAACIMSRWMIWWPHQRRMAVSQQRIWEGSLLCDIRAMSPYPALRKGEDSAMVYDLCNRERVVTLDMPRLYTYVVHGKNTFDEKHFEKLWRNASFHYTNERYFAVLGEMSKRLPLNDASTTPGGTDASSRLPSRPVFNPSSAVEQTTSSKYLLKEPAGREAKIPSSGQHEKMIAAAIWVEGRTDRLESLMRLKKQVSRIGMPFKVYRAITPKSLPYIVCDYRIFNSSHEIACLSSHLSLIRELSSLNLEYALILEDDAILHDKLNISDVMQSAPDDWEILSLSTSQRVFYEKYKVMVKFGGPKWLAWQSDCWGSYAYIIKGDAMKKLSSRFWNSSNQLNLKGMYDPFSMVSDNVVFRHVKTYVSRYPWSTFNKKIQSTIQFNTTPSSTDVIHIEAARMIDDIWSKGV
jgi:glycosyltransferase involved in cell wall biosynthesis